VPAHCRMRANDRDLIRGGHYGQRPRVPRLKAEHMAAPTNAAYVKKVLANSEPSTHGTKRTIAALQQFVRFWTIVLQNPLLHCERAIIESN
jgi:hypothetical protein